MFKKILKSCLVAVSVCAMATSLFAEVTAKVSGRIVAEALQVTVKDGASYLDMASQGRIGVAVSADAGDWKVGGVTQLRTIGGKVNDNLYNYANMQNDTLKIQLGRQWWGICNTGAKYGGKTIDRKCLGLNAVSARDDRLTVKLKNVGLTVMLEMNMENGDATNDAYTQTGFGLNYGKSFGSLGLKVEFTSASRAGNEKLEAASKDGVNDGAAKSDLTLGVTYAISDTFGVDFQYESASTKATSNADETKISWMGLGADIGFSDTMGLGFYYDMGSTAVGSGDAVAASLVTINLQTKMDALTMNVGLNSETTADGDAGKTTIAGGFYFPF